MMSGCACNRALKASNTFGRGAIEQHLDEHQHAGAELQRIEAAPRSPGCALARQPLHARQHRGRRQRHRLCQLEVRQASVALQRIEDAQVDAIEIGRSLAIPSVLFGTLLEFSVKLTANPETIAS